jgi:hypothetical protein
VQAACLEIPQANTVANRQTVVSAGGALACAELTWGEGSEAALCRQHGPFDIVLCSDCAVWEEAFPALVSTLVALCARPEGDKTTPVVWLALKERKPNNRGSGCNIAPFFELLDQEFERVAAKPTEALRAEIARTGGSSTGSKLVSEVRLYELRPKRRRAKTQVGASSAGEANCPKPAVGAAAGEMTD